MQKKDKRDKNFLRNKGMDVNRRYSMDRDLRTLILKYIRKYEGIPAVVLDGKGEDKRAKSSCV